MIFKKIEEIKIVTCQKIDEVVSSFDWFDRNMDSLFDNIVIYTKLK